MKKERRRDQSSDDESSVLLEACVDVYEKKSKRRFKGKQKQKSKAKTQSVTGWQAFTHNLQRRPKKTLKRTVIRVGFYCWTIAVILSVFSLLGIPVMTILASPLSVSALDSHFDRELEDSRRILRTADDENQAGSDEAGSYFPSWSSLSTNIFPASGFMSNELGSLSSLDGLDALDVDENELHDETEEDFEPIPQQVLPAVQKQGNKLNKKFEKELACEEEICIEACNKKMKPKCAKSVSCRKERERVCKRRCRKQRCEDRCKDEPKFGYVEREQRMEKCKDDCSGPTAVHNKCIKKCHSQFKPCKSRCHEIANKYICDKPTEPPITISIQKEPATEFSNLAASRTKHGDTITTSSLLDDPEII